ncbi:MAG TPA: helix-hairpin-helix domain-containing protein [Terriglobales bacterium]|nr:helix-hairpin-helix domain-containing protein [Terriglobales bacterium]
MGVVRQRSRPELRVHSEPVAASRPETSGGSGAAGGGAAEVRSSAEGAGGAAEGILNSATRQQLLSVYGIGPVLADRIIQNRPYKTAYEVVEKGIIPETIFVQLRKQLLQQHEA